MHKKILIIGQPFNKFSGGGITLSNLFFEWDKDKIAVATTGHGIDNADFSICNNYYCLGEQEHKWIFPLKYFQRRFNSGNVNGSLINNCKTQVNSKSNILSKIRSFSVKHMLFPLLHLLGLSHCISHIEVSKKFLTWFDDFKPEIVYTQLSTYELINFILKLNHVRDFKLAIHIMDDWPETISKRGILHGYWKRRINNNLRVLINQSTVLLSISEGMSDEYKIRYNKIFIPFHNPIDSSEWLKYSKKSWIPNPLIQVIYSGRIGTANSKSVKDICAAIGELKNSGSKINMTIYTNDFNSRKANKLKKINGVQISNSIPYSQMPHILAEADILILPLDFDSKGIRFNRLSMPTKASEYMISGTPTIVFASELTHLFQHADKNKWALTLGSRDIEALKYKIRELSENIQLRKKIGRQAQGYALKNFEAEDVRRKFMELLETS